MSNFFLCMFYNVFFKLIFILNSFLIYKFFQISLNFLESSLVYSIYFLYYISFLYLYLFTILMYYIYSVLYVVTLLQFN